MMANRDIIVIGASMGGVEALTKLAKQLPAGLPAALFIVQHISPDATSMLPDILNRAGPLPAKAAEDGETIRHGRIYVAPPNRHLLVKHDHVRLSSGPHENRTRPAIDPLFRSAAIAYGARVVGVVLTGLLDDGTAGLLAIKRCGGLAVVQSPEDALYPDMPQNALDSVAVDNCLALADVGALLARLAQQPAGESPPVPADLLLELKVLQNIRSDVKSEERLGDRSPLTCPQCGGTLWQLYDNGPPRYLCHVGHAFTGRALLAEQDENLEQAFWAAMRALEERARLLASLVSAERAAGRQRSAEIYEKRLAETRGHVEQIRALLLPES